MRSSQPRRTNLVLWIVQGLLTALFLFAGGMKLFGPSAMLKGPMLVPVPFLRVIGLLELAGALGLVLPGLFHTRTHLTALAAGGLGIIMSGATGVMIVGSQGRLAPALLPFVVGLLAAFVSYGRTRLAPLAATRRTHRQSHTRLVHASAA